MRGNWLGTKSCRMMGFLCVDMVNAVENLRHRMGCSPRCMTPAAVVGGNPPRVPTRARTGRESLPSLGCSPGAHGRMYGSRLLLLDAGYLPSEGALGLA